MTIRVNGEEYHLDGYANTNELQKSLLACYQQGRADAIDECIKALDVCVNCTIECENKDYHHRECMADVNISHLWIVKILKQLKEKSDE